MIININMKANEDNVLDPKATEIATAFVEIENAIKFPIKIRKYRDKDTGNEKTFISYPQRQTGEGKWEYVFYPKDEEVKKELERAIYDKFAFELRKSVHLNEVENVKVTLLDNSEKTGDVTLKALATVTIYGCNIYGVMVKESKNGLFVQMPQYQANGQYKDMVYGSTKQAQEVLKEAVLEKYHKELNKAQTKEAPEEQPVVEQEEKEAIPQLKPIKNLSPRL